jgi:hypothetical protein
MPRLRPDSVIEMLTLRQGYQLRDSGSRCAALVTTDTQSRQSKTIPRKHKPDVRKVGSMYSLPALSWRFVEDFAVPASLGFHLEVDLGVDIGRINRHVAEFNVLSTEAILLDVMHFHVQRNISVYNTFFTKCVATHLIKEVSGGD